MVQKSQYDLINKKKMNVNKILIFLVLISAFSYNCSAQNDNVVGKYSVTFDEIKKVTEQPYNEEPFDIYIFRDNTFMYYPKNPIWGYSVSSGIWRLKGDTLLLDSTIKNLECIGVGRFDMPFNKISFQIFKRNRVGGNWHEKADKDDDLHFFIITDSGTYENYADSLGMIVVDKSQKVKSIYIEDWGRKSNVVKLSKDTDLNYYIVTYTPYRQFDKEKWIVLDENKIRPKNFATNTFAKYVLQRDITYDEINGKPTPINPQLQNLKSKYPRADNWIMNANQILYIDEKQVKL